MSRENVEVLRRAFEGLNARSAETMEDLVAPDAEWRPVLTAGGDLERRVYRGTAGMVQYWTDLDELFEGTEVQVEELDPIGPHHVLFAGRVTARGRTSGVPLDERIWALWELRDRKLYRGTAYRSRAEALEAVGLSEWGMSENVEAVYRTERAFNEGDVEAFVSFLHPDIEWDTGLLGTPTYRGHDGIRKMLRDVQAAWADIQMEIVGDPVERDDAVLLEARLVAHGRSTGAPVEATQFWVDHFLDDLCVRHQAFLTKAEALEAVGLSE